MITMEFETRLQDIEKNLTNIVGCYKDTHNITIIIPYYHDKNTDRMKEIDLALKLNTMNKLFSRIVIINETNEKINIIDETDKRIVVVNVDKRYTFNDFFLYSNQHTSDDTINILINTDIVIGEQFDSIVLTDKQSICLSRYEILDENKYGVVIGGGSHDCWMWKGKIVDTIGNFQMGKQHCDGILANELHVNGYILKNPVYDVKIYHLHISAVRNYTFQNDMIYGQRRGVTFTKNDNVFTLNDTYNDGGLWD
jgi:hypothetical protein